MDGLGISSYNFVTVSVFFLLPYVFLFRRSLFPANVHSLSRRLLRNLLTLLVIGHTLYTLQLLVAPPVNLFTLLNLPLTASISAIRVALLEHQKDRFPVGFQNKLSPDVEALLTRLTSFEARVIYVRYGPYPLSYCSPCVHLSDFAIFALAPTVLPYLRALILVSLITSRPTFRIAWRTPSLSVLAATFLTEVWWTADGTVQFHEGKFEGWTHTHIYIARYTILLLLPFAIHHLPAHSAPSALPPFITILSSRPTFPHQSSDFHLSNGNSIPQTPQRRSVPPPHAQSQVRPSALDSGVQQSMSPFAALNGTLNTLGTTLNTLRVLEWTRMAGLRRRELREQVFMRYVTSAYAKRTRKISDYHVTEGLNATYARSDEDLLREAEKVGMAYGTFRRRGKGPEETPRVHQRFRGGRKTWRGADDPRGLDSDSLAEDDGADEEDEGKSKDDERQQETERLEEDVELASSPLRARAKKAAQELGTYLRRVQESPGAG
ncbi:hypothetical protein K439DRAFT_228423 [Ramaria rubella]|nr:hypothetical protein K439DRAFT_228423 [Ramaria rubella]